MIGLQNYPLQLELVETQYATERAAASRDQGPLGLVDRVPVDAELVTGARLELGPETEPNRRRETNR